MREFIVNALPFVLIGLTWVNLFVKHIKGERTYLSEGVCLGTCLGASLSAILDVDFRLSACLLMFVGQAIGSFIKKK